MEESLMECSCRNGFFEHKERVSLVLLCFKPCYDLKYFFTGRTRKRNEL